MNEKCEHQFYICNKDGKFIHKCMKCGDEKEITVEERKEWD